MAGKSNASAKAQQVRTQKYIDIAVSKGANVASAAVNKAAAKGVTMSPSKRKSAIDNAVSYNMANKRAKSKSAKINYK